MDSAAQEGVASTGVACFSSSMEGAEPANVLCWGRDFALYGLWWLVGCPASVSAGGIVAVASPVEPGTPSRVRKGSEAMTSAGVSRTGMREAAALPPAPRNMPADAPRAASSRISRKARQRSVPTRRWTSGGDRLSSF